MYSNKGDCSGEKIAINISLSLQKSSVGTDINNGFQPGEKTAMNPF